MNKEKLTKKILLFFMQTKSYSFLMLRILPYIRFSIYYSDFPGWKIKRGYKKLKPGDIVITNDRKKLTGMLIKWLTGGMAHGALCVAKSMYEEFEIAEMTHENFKQNTFASLCSESTRVKIYRCTSFDRRYVDRVLVPECLSYRHVMYDVHFRLGVKSLYCFELIYHSDRERRMKVSLDDAKGIGRKYLSSVGIHNASNIKLIWDSDQETK